MDLKSLRKEIRRLSTSFSLRIILVEWEVFSKLVVRGRNQHRRDKCYQMLVRVCKDLKRYQSSCYLTDVLKFVKQPGKKLKPIVTTIKLCLQYSEKLLQFIGTTFREVEIQLYMGLFVPTNLLMLTSLSRIWYVLQYHSQALRKLLTLLVPEHPVIVAASARVLPMAAGSVSTAIRPLFSVPAVSNLSTVSCFRPTSTPAMPASCTPPVKIASVGATRSTPASIPAVPASCTPPVVSGALVVLPSDTPPVGSAAIRASVLPSSVAAANVAGIPVPRVKSVHICHDRKSCGSDSAFQEYKLSSSATTSFAQVIPGNYCAVTSTKVKTDGSVQVPRHSKHSSPVKRRKRTKILLSSGDRRVWVRVLQNKKEYRTLAYKYLILASMRRASMFHRDSVMSEGVVRLRSRDTPVSSVTRLSKTGSTQMPCSKRERSNSGCYKKHLSIRDLHMQFLEDLSVACDDVGSEVTYDSSIIDHLFSEI